MIFNILSNYHKVSTMYISEKKKEKGKLGKEEADMLVKKDKANFRFRQSKLVAYLKLT